MTDVADGTERERVVSVEEHLEMVLAPTCDAGVHLVQRQRDRALIRAALEAAADELERIINAQPQPPHAPCVAMRFYGAVRALHEHPEAVLAQCVAATTASPDGDAAGEG